MRNSHASGVAAFLILAALGAKAGAADSCPEGGATSDCEKKQPPNVERVPDLSTMKPPEAPAFLALGVAPTEIQRPVTPTEFAVALASGLAHGTSFSPLDNFAIQASPYWMAKHPNLTAADLDGQSHWAFLRNFSLSAGAASAKLTDAAGASVDAKRWAVGARTTIYPGWQSTAAKECQTALVEALDKGSGELAKARTAFEEEWDQKHARPPRPNLPELDADAPGFKVDGVFNKPLFDAARNAWLAKRAHIRAADRAYTDWLKERAAATQAWLADYAKGRAEDPVLTRCLTTIHDRIGFMAEVAGAFSMTLPGSDFEQMPALRSRLQTYWLTAGYVLDRGPGYWNHALDISLLAIGRLQAETPGSGDSIRRLDAGARVVLAWDRYGLSVEGTYRRQTIGSLSPANLSRVGVGVDFRLSGGAWATVVFGKDFGSPDSTPLIALANLQWNLGIDRQLSLDRSLTQEPSGEEAGKEKKPGASP